MRAINYLEELPPEIMQKLKVTEIYQRFTFERAKLSRMAYQAWEETGKINSPKVIEQNDMVDALGVDVLDEIKNIKFMLHEPTFEDFQAMRCKVKND